MKVKSDIKHLKHLRWLIIIFALLHALLIVAPALLNEQFALMPLMRQGDVLDLITPLILIPLYWLLLQFCTADYSSPRETLIFIILAIVWVEGHGIHLASNSIAHLTKELPGSEIATLTNFYDEKLSHYLWHFSLFGLSGLLIYRQWRNPFLSHNSHFGYEIVGGIIHGSICFIDVIESATVYLALPLTIGFTLFGFWGKQYLKSRPLIIFFWTAYLLASLLIVGWGLYWGGFPEFSQVGIID